MSAGPAALTVLGPSPSSSTSPARRGGRAEPADEGKGVDFSTALASQCDVASATDAPVAQADTASGDSQSSPRHAHRREEDRASPPGDTGAIPGAVPLPAQSQALPVRNPGAAEPARGDAVTATVDGAVNPGTGPAVAAGSADGRAAPAATTVSPLTTATDGAATMGVARTSEAVPGASADAPAVDRSGDDANDAVARREIRLAARERAGAAALTPTTTPIATAAPEVAATALVAAPVRGAIAPVAGRSAAAPARVATTASSSPARSAAATVTDPRITERPWAPVSAGAPNAGVEAEAGAGRRSSEASVSSDAPLQVTVLEPGSAERNQAAISLAAAQAQPALLHAATARADAVFSADPAASTVHERIATPLTSPEFAGALAVKVDRMLQGGTHHAQLEITPPDMGLIKVQLTLQGTDARVEFVAASAQTRQVLEDALPALSDRLQQSGLNLAGADVSTGQQYRPDSQAAWQAAGNSGSGGEGSRPRARDELARGSVSGISRAKGDLRAARAVRPTAAGGLDLYA